MSTNVWRAGVHPDAAAAFQRAGVTADRVSQGIGHAAASAGTHERDGIGPDGHPYCCATDLRVRDLTHDQRIALLGKLADEGFAPFLRVPNQDHWPASDVLHMHVVWPGAKMKQALRHQVHDYCHSPMLNGLASHVEYKAWQPTPEQQQKARELFLASGNPVTG